MVPHAQEGGFILAVHMEGIFQYMDNRNGYRFPTEVQLQHAATKTRAQIKPLDTVLYKSKHSTDSLALYKTRRHFEDLPATAATSQCSSSSMTRRGLGLQGLLSKLWYISSCTQTTRRRFFLYHGPPHAVNLRISVFSTRPIPRVRCAGERL